MAVIVPSSSVKLNGETKMEDYSGIPAKFHEDAKLAAALGTPLAYPSDKKDQSCPCCRQSHVQPQWEGDCLYVIYCRHCKHEICSGCYYGHFFRRDRPTLCSQINDRNYWVSVGDSAGNSPDKSEYCRNICCCGKPVNSANHCSECTYSYCNDCFKRHNNEPACEILAPKTQNVGQI